jgi:7-cyano-7-deazaguanine reductase
LISINRFDIRKQTGLDSLLTNMHGIDAWTSYELSWLDLNSIPKNEILYLTYDSSSKKFIESKSLKLYLNSLNNCKFTNKENLLKTLQEDIGSCIQSNITIEILPTPKSIEDSSLCIDDSIVQSVSKKVNSLVLQTKEMTLEENLSSRLFRSLCPITSQPDWATITIYYKGPQIVHETLLSYLLSYRNHQGFHEDCVERIFSDILKRCFPESLTVRANFLRRGGIEINPIRSTSIEFEKEIFRSDRQ